MKTDNRSTSIQDPEDFPDSFCGSIGSESILIQKIPTFANINASKLPESSLSPADEALFSAVLSNNSARCKELLLGKQPPNVNSKNSASSAVLHLASSAGHVTVCEVLLDYSR